VSRFWRRAPALEPSLAARVRAWRALPESTLTGPAHATEWVVVDTETTGLWVQQDRLVAIAAVRVYGGAVWLGGAFERILRQAAELAPQNTLVHGIGNEMASAGQPPADALMDWLEFIGRRPLVAYHAGFDARFLARGCLAHLGFSPDLRWLDLARLAQGVWPASADAPLDRRLADHGIDIVLRHSALSDALATAQLFLTAMARPGFAQQPARRLIAEHSPPAD
jgi:DNA polymerase-3 subunit epsilon